MNKRQRAYSEKVTYEISWAKFERREKWRQCIELYNQLSAAQLLRLKRDYPEAYAWLKENA